MLVVVEDGDLHALLERLLDVEALGRLDVLEVDAAERRLERGDDLDELLRVLLGQLDVEHVDAGELLEEAALAFHHRLGGERSDVAQAEHRGAVGDDADEVAARGVLRRQVRIGLDGEARVGDAGRIGEREVALVRERLGRRHRDLAEGRRAVVFERRVAQRLLGIAELHLGVVHESVSG